MAAFIYRVEGTDGLGSFNTYDWWSYEGLKKSHNQIPSPMFDEKLKSYWFDDDYYFGFRNLREFLIIYEDFLDALLTTSLRLYKYKVTNFIQGTGQVMYLLDSVISKRDVTEEVLQKFKLTN